MDPLTIVQTAEVVVGAVALVYAIHLQFLLRAENPYAVGMFWALGSALILTHIGDLFEVFGTPYKVYIDLIGVVIVFVGMTVAWVRVIRQVTPGPNSGIKGAIWRR